VQDVAAEVPGEAFGIGDRRRHAAKPVAGVDHDVVLVQFRQPDRGADPGRPSADDKEAGRASQR
jgi:hypothetical protein